MAESTASTPSGNTTAPPPPEPPTGAHLRQSRVITLVVRRQLHFHLQEVGALRLLRFQHRLQLLAASLERGEVLYRALGHEQRAPLRWTNREGRARHAKRQRAGGGEEKQGCHGGLSVRDGLGAQFTDLVWLGRVRSRRSQLKKLKIGSDPKKNLHTNQHNQSCVSRIFVLRTI